MPMEFVLKILFVFLFLISSGLTSNNWIDFEATEIYHKYDLKDCVFPFIFNGTTYHNCTTDGDNSPRPWCSLHANYIGAYKLCYDQWNSELKCVFPFTLNDVEHKQCVVLTKRKGYVYKQCRTNSNFTRYRYCIEEYVSKSTRPLVHSDNCEQKYKNISRDHAKCMGPSEFAIQRVMSSGMIQELVDIHNKHRSAVEAQWTIRRTFGEKSKARFFKI
ncbi:unnamed protein product [Didymodactylos carnosus]|uniref:Fibronectin type-II domain-containing protein n=1 Tax=Didymodactylos carnosus TaxID=1234261 RepID=A0A814WNY7_9BILA|nr:unnamed protein product [Didymodactylos carnosus]CAF3965430.1 unnamed protein product [Didymodactylos carnosus]